MSKKPTIKNNSLRDIGTALRKAESILIYPHILMDGDAMGSAAALCSALRAMNKRALIVVEDKVPDYLKFMDKAYTIPVDAIMGDNAPYSEFRGPDVSFCVDCSSSGRFPRRKELFETGKVKICLDHHLDTEAGLCDLRYIDSDSAATGELVYLLLQEMDRPLTPEISNALFAAITTDTGNFQYANTTPRSHQIVVDLYRSGLESYPVSVALYENVPLRRIKLHSRILEGLETFADGQAAMASVTQEMLREFGALMEDTEGVVATVRSIHGVQIAAILKEQEDGSIKVSMRAESKGDVQAICARHGGGGHKKAAGMTLEGVSLEEVKDLIRTEVTEALR